MLVREANHDDFNAICTIFHEVVSAGDTYAYDRDITKSDAFHQWMESPEKTFVVEERDQILGICCSTRQGPGNLYV